MQIPITASARLLEKKILLQHAIRELISPVEPTQPLNFAATAERCCIRLEMPLLISHNS